MLTAALPTTSYALVTPSCTCPPLAPTPSLDTPAGLSVLQLQGTPRSPGQPPHHTAGPCSCSARLSAAQPRRLCAPPLLGRIRAGPGALISGFLSSSTSTRRRTATGTRLCTGGASLLATSHVPALLLRACLALHHEPLRAQHQGRFHPTPPAVRNMCLGCLGEERNRHWGWEESSEETANRCQVPLCEG